MNRRATFAVIAVVASVASSCGGDLPFGGGPGDTGDPGEFVGFRREPPPVVADFELPDLSDGGAPFALRADPGELLVIYFGYTNCPDFCPTTLADVRAARQQLDEPERVEVAMIAVDPDRDLAILDEYVSGFFPEGGHALGTSDAGLLARVAAPFGAQYEVVENDDGEIEVGHRTDLYAVDDQGRLALTWSFGVSKDDLAADFERLLDATTT